jgi:copper chaperone CopZ
MKRKFSMLFAAILLIGWTSLNGQSPLKETVKLKIKTSMTCDGCKETLFDGLAYEKGIKDLDINLESNTITVTYQTWKNDSTSIKNIIKDLGYVAEVVNFKKIDKSKKKR